MNCLQPDCPDETRPYSGRGPQPSYCPEHSKPSYRKARSRNGVATRPACCQAQGRGKCEQHRKERTHRYELSPDAILDSPEAKHTQFREVIASGLDIRSPWRAIAGSPFTNWGATLTWDGELIPVIGQSDLDAYWNPVTPKAREQFPVKSGRGELIRRGHEWPWKA